jgi:hypothetical protein
MLNYDPDDKPKLDTAMLMEAREFGLHPVNVICDEPDARVGHHGGVSFIAFAAFAPQVGDRIEIQDGKLCEVKRAYYKVSQIGKTAMFSLVPNLYAVRVDGDEGTG